MSEPINPYESPLSDLSGPDPIGIPAPTSPADILLSAQGRIPRSTFWLYSIPLTIAFYGLAGLVGTLQDPALGASLLFLAIYIALVWMSVVISIKRWHDRDKSGWWILIAIIPIVGAVWTFVETGCLRGTAGANRFGDDPLALR